LGQQRQRVVCQGEVDFEFFLDRENEREEFGKMIRPWDGGNGTGCFLG